ncbi:MAG TPA: type 1 glutamine amidotransferase [Casimicrobiaceae bacterium]|nr:type 1 glutamine amidotransferase [Casimicrobiaceae bacterium]
MLPVAIFRFSPTEGPGRFGQWLSERGRPQRLIALDQAEAVPTDARAFAGIGLMGGPMSANDDLPWNAPLLALLRQAVEADVPVVGHCLGGQLLAKALGARVAPTPAPEIGWGPVTVTGEAAWFGARSSFTTFQWHYDVFELPPGATRVLTNDVNPQQGYALGRHIGLQCHIEMTREMVETWCRAGADELPARSNGARQSGDDILRDLDARLDALSRVADDVYARWAQGLRN